jgi:anthranilate phosphoribosyltransferase
MRHAGPTRREIGVRTAFNLLGPITNPAGARRQVVGVGDPAAAPRLAEVLRALGTERALVVHGAGLDELPLDGSGIIYDVTPGGIERRTIDAVDLGLARAESAALAGGSPAENALVVEAVLDGSERGARRDVVLLNAAAAFVAAGRTEDLAAGVALAAATIDAGSAAALLARLRAEKAAADVVRAAAESAGTSDHAAASADPVRAGSAPASATSEVPA